MAVSHICVNADVGLMTTMVPCRRDGEMSEGARARVERAREGGWERERNGKGGGD